MVDACEKGPWWYHTAVLANGCLIWRLRAKMLPDTRHRDPCPMVTAPDSPEIPPVATAAVPAVESRPKREGLARITVRTQRVRSDGETTRVVSISTHVSLDALLFS